MSDFSANTASVLLRLEGGESPWTLPGMLFLNKNSSLSMEKGVIGSNSCQFLHLLSHNDRFILFFFKCICLWFWGHGNPKSQSGGHKNKKSPKHLWPLIIRMILGPQPVYTHAPRPALILPHWCYGRELLLKKQQDFFPFKTRRGWEEQNLGQKKRGKEAQAENDWEEMNSSFLSPWRKSGYTAEAVIRPPGRSH